MDGSLPITQIRDVTGALEDRVKEHFPQIAQATIHPEPVEEWQKGRSGGVCARRKIATYNSIREIWRRFQELDRNVHSWVLEKFPGPMLSTDKALDALFQAFGHGAFGLFIALLLTVLVASNVISKIVAFSLGAAWVIALIWLARLRPVKDLSIISRWGVVLVGATIFALALILLGSWTLHQVSLQKSAEKATKPPEPQLIRANSDSGAAMNRASDAGNGTNANSAKPKKERLPEAFAVAIESKLLVPGPSKDEAGTGFWGVSRFGPNCFVRSADVVMLLRIKSLEPVKTMITAYNVYGIGGEFKRIKMTTNTPVQILGHGVIPANFSGRVSIPIPAPSGNLGGGIVAFKFSDTDFSIAAPMADDILDKEIADSYLSPGDTVRGWAFFEYPSVGSIPARLTLTIADDLGHTFSYVIPDARGNPSGDALRRELTITGPTMNLSSCIRLPHSAVSP
jgi:hypothetical protein